MKYNLVKIFAYLIGKAFNPIFIFHNFYNRYKINRKLGGENRCIENPYLVRGIENIHVSNYVYIGPGSTIYTTNAKLIIEHHVTIGPNLTIITGDHNATVIGSYIYETKEKLFENDKDVIIESDVWIGCNVTILKGVTIGKGSIVAAGSVVVNSCPPYSIIGGVPSKVLKKRFTDEEIIIHEKLLNKRKL